MADRTGNAQQGDDERDGAAQVVRLPLDAIRPNPAQPRQRFDAVALAELAASLREHGVLQPVLVRSLPDGAYELIAGERRWQAARQAGLDALPALIVRASPRRAQELALVENVQRADLTPLEEAEAYRGLMAELGLTHERLAERLGVSRVAVTNRLRLLTLNPATRQALAEGRITEGHARALLALRGERQDEALRTITSGGLSVRQAERLARRLGARPSSLKDTAPETGTGVDMDVEAVTERLRRALGARVRVRRHRAGATVWIHVHALDALYQLAEALDPLGGDDEL